MCRRAVIQERVCDLRKEGAGRNSGQGRKCSSEMQARCPGGESGELRPLGAEVFLFKYNHIFYISGSLITKWKTASSAKGTSKAFMEIPYYSPSGRKGEP